MEGMGDLVNIFELNIKNMPKFKNGLLQAEFDPVFKPLVTPILKKLSDEEVEEYTGKDLLQDLSKGPTEVGKKLIRRLVESLM